MLFAGLISKNPELLLKKHKAILKDSKERAFPLNDLERTNIQNNGSGSSNGAAGSGNIISNDNSDN